MIPNRVFRILLGALLIAGCDLQKDDSDAVLFNGTWRLVEAGSRQTDFTALVLARYDAIIVTFIAEEEEFAMILDVSGSPEDDIFNGTFVIDSEDREIDLRSARFPRIFDFDYHFVNADKVVLTSDDDDPILETLFGIELDVEDIFLVFERT